jgi:hypothetical protein
MKFLKKYTQYQDEADMFKLVDTRPTLVQNQEANKCDAQLASSGLISSSILAT